MKSFAKALALFAIVVIGCTVSAFSLYNLYTNSKTDGHGNGHIRVTECNEDDYAWRMYTCRGEYFSGAGMVYVPNVSVGVTGHDYMKGEFIEDVYPNTSLQGGPDFVTGRERSSVMYNIPWLSLLAVGGLMLGSVLLYICGARLIRSVSHQEMHGITGTDRDLK